MVIKTLDTSLQRREKWARSNTLAHSGVVRVIVDDKPIRSTQTANGLIALLRKQQEFYRTQGRYTQAEHRLRMVEVYERAIGELKLRAAND